MPRAGRSSHRNQNRPSSAPPGSVRLQRLMADAGVASRRKCEELIETGHVEVNGAPATRLPVFVNPTTDRVTVDGRPLKLGAAGRPAERRLYIMVNKPAGYVCSTADQFGRPTVLDLVRHPAGARLYPVGRLEFDAVGMVLLTNDGALTDRLTHARHGAAKTYHVTVKGVLDDGYIADLERGLSTKGRRAAEMAGGRAGEFTVRHAGRLTAGSRGERSADRTVLEISVRAGKHRHLDDLLGEAGLKVAKIEQVALGPLMLKGLAPGTWRELTRDELSSLRRPAVLEPGAQPGRPGRSSRTRPTRPPHPPNA